MCLEFTRANTGSRYGRNSIEAKTEAGFSPASPVDRHYGGIWMARPCPECSCASEEECLTLKSLGFACETTRAAGRPA